MKIKLIFVLSISFLMLFTHCKTGKNSQKKNTPEYVADKFLFHLNRLELEEAKQYGTESTKNILNLLQSMVAFIPDQQAPELVTVVISHCEVQGNIAICHYTSNNKSDTLELLNVDGVWLVNLKKESFTAPKIKVD